MPFLVASPPRITFWDTTLVTPAYVDIDLPRPALGGLDIQEAVDRVRNRVETGDVQAGAWYAKDEIKYRSDFVQSAIAALVRRLWKSTRALETFTFKLHRDLSGPYENASVNIWDNLWTVRWKEGFDRLPLRSSGAYGVWILELEMEALAVEV